MRVLLIIFLTGIFHLANAQNPPEEMSFSTDGKRLTSGANPVDGFYQLNKIRVIELIFDQADYWAQLVSNYQSKKDIPATLIHDGKTYPNVGVRFKGQTSYQRVTSQKKSFNITMDFSDDTQDLRGYETLNLNNSYEDNSYIREVLYENITRPFCPSLKANYVHLYINGQDWGLYPSVQALDNEYVQQWFLSSDGTRWRCERTTPGGGGMGGFGAGTSTLNYLGDDTTLYKPHYTLKKTSLENPWSDLARVTKVLNTVPLAELEDTLNKVLDIDRALWFLAKEILFGDDDSYINKGGMDYYAIYQKDVERLIPLEYDANSIMKAQTSSWSLFLKENDTRYPLANRLFAVPELRQRYLAHLRSMVKQALDSVYFTSTVNELYAMIDTLVQSDPKKLMSYTAWQNEKNVLLTWLKNRRTYAFNNTEFKQQGNEISEVLFASSGIVGRLPYENETLEIQAKISGGDGVESAYLYFARGYDGYFNKVQLYDDGNHDDGSPNDGVYGASIPAYPAGSFVRYYIEARNNNAAKTSSFMPEGAEHDVFIYQVNVNPSIINEIVINEFMASNKSSVQDQDGEYDDWIELYNKSAIDIDISRWILTDNPANLDKYRVPEGTILKSDSYLIIWADEDGKQNGYHANFKLSADGEQLILLDSTGLQVDQVSFGPQQEDQAYARKPNGTGDFIIQSHTFNKNNDLIISTEYADNNEFSFYPNPAKKWIVVNHNFASPARLELIDLQGKIQLSLMVEEEQLIDLNDVPSGFYLLSVKGKHHKLLIN